MSLEGMTVQTEIFDSVPLQFIVTAFVGPNAVL